MIRAGSLHLLLRRAVVGSLILGGSGTAFAGAYVANPPLSLQVPVYANQSAITVSDQRSEYAPKLLGPGSTEYPLGMFAIQPDALSNVDGASAPFLNRGSVTETICAAIDCLGRSCTQMSTEVDLLGLSSASAAYLDGPGSLLVSGLGLVGLGIMNRKGTAAR
jgi:hypothetical protein